MNLKEILAGGIVLGVLTIPNLSCSYNQSLPQKSITEAQQEATESQLKLEVRVKGNNVEYTANCPLKDIELICELSTDGKPLIPNIEEARQSGKLRDLFNDLAKILAIDFIYKATEPEKTLGDIKEEVYKGKVRIIGHYKSMPLKKAAKERLLLIKKFSEESTFGTIYKANEKETSI